MDYVSPIPHVHVAREFSVYTTIFSLLPFGSNALLFVSFSFPFLISSGCNSPFPFSENVVYTENLVYGTGYVTSASTQGTYELMDLSLDVVAPKDLPGMLKPAVILIHGGNFSGGTRKDDNLLMLSDFLASNGYVCFLIDYRLEGDHPPQPEDFPKFEFPSPGAVRAAIVDAKTAIRHVRAYAETYEVDPDRIAVFGESAGAIAAIGAGITAPDRYANDGEGFPVPAGNNPRENPIAQAIIDCWGSADFFLDDFDENDPPMMIWHGTNDLTPGTFFTSALLIRDQCEAYNIPHQFHPIYGEGHGAWEAESDGMNLARTILSFLNDYMP